MLSETKVSQIVAILQHNDGDIMFIKQGDDPKAKILRIVDADEIDASIEDIVKKQDKSQNFPNKDLKEEAK